MSACWEACLVKWLVVVHSAACIKNLYAIKPSVHSMYVINFIDMSITHLVQKKLESLENRPTVVSTVMLTQYTILACKTANT